MMTVANRGSLRTAWRGFFWRGDHLHVFHLLGQMAVPRLHICQLRLERPGPEIQPYSVLLRPADFQLQLGIRRADFRRPVFQPLNGPSQLCALLSLPRPRFSQMFHFLLRQVLLLNQPPPIVLGVR